MLAVAGVAVVLGRGGRAVRPRRSAARPAALAPVSAAHIGRRLAMLERRGDATIRQLAALGRPVYCGGRHGHELALTFDDGPGVYTRLALRKLREARERATFFVVGKSMNRFPGYLTRERRVGALGDHTYTHLDLAELPEPEIYTQIERDRIQIERQSGQPVDLFRPPYGALDPAVLAVARSLHLLTIMWTQDSGDSLGANYARIIHNVQAAMRPGAIILPELFATDPPSVAMVRRGQAACGHVQISVGSG